MRGKLMAGLVLLLCSVALQAEQIYRWVDADGVALPRRKLPRQPRSSARMLPCDGPTALPRAMC